jgi:hypothetical protein
LALLSGSAVPSVVPADDMDRCMGIGIWEAMPVHFGLGSRLLSDSEKKSFHLGQDKLNSLITYELNSLLAYHKKEQHKVFIHSLPKLDCFCNSFCCPLRKWKAESFVVQNNLLLPSLFFPKSFGVMQMQP